MQAIRVITSTQIPLDVVFEPPETLAADWFGAQLFEPVRWWLFLSPTAIALAGALPGLISKPPVCSVTCCQPQPPLEFVEGLWETAALELFIRDDVTDAYLELHLAPNGACWAGYFPETRKLDRTWARPQGSISVSWLKHNNTTYPCLSFQRKGLPISCTFSSKSRVAVCAMWKQGHRFQYCSCFADGIQPPDFHQPRKFLPLELTPI